MKFRLLSVISLLTFSFVMRADHDHLGMGKQPAITNTNPKNTGISGLKNKGINANTPTTRATTLTPAVSASIMTPSVLAGTPNTGTVSSSGY